MRPFGIAAQELGRARLALQDVELDALERDTELRQEQPHLVAVAGFQVVVEPQHARHLPTSPRASISVSARRRLGPLRHRGQAAQRLDVGAPRPARARRRRSRSGRRPARTWRRRSRSRRTGTARARAARARQSRQIALTRAMSASSSGVDCTLAGPTRARSSASDCAATAKPECISAEIARASARSVGARGHRRSSGKASVRYSQIASESQTDDRAVAQRRHPAGRRVRAHARGELRRVHRRRAPRRTRARSGAARATAAATTTSSSCCRSGARARASTSFSSARGARARAPRCRGSRARAARRARGRRRRRRARRASSREISTPPIGAFFCRWPATSSTGLYATPLARSTAERPVCTPIRTRNSRCEQVLARVPGAQPACIARAQRHRVVGRLEERHDLVAVRVQDRARCAPRMRSAT